MGILEKALGGHVATFLLAGVVAVVVVVGGAVVIAGNMSFHDYLDELRRFVWPIVGLGAARSGLAVAKSLGQK